MSLVVMALELDNGAWYVRRSRISHTFLVEPLLQRMESWYPLVDLEVCFYEWAEELFG